VAVRSLVPRSVCGSAVGPTVDSFPLRQEQNPVDPRIYFATLRRKLRSSFLTAMSVKVRSAPGRRLGRRQKDRIVPIESGLLVQIPLRTLPLIAQKAALATRVGPERAIAGT
jgi:hypothetical protein